MTVEDEMKVSIVLVSTVRLCVSAATRYANISYDIRFASICTTARYTTRHTSPGPVLFLR